MGQLVYILGRSGTGKSYGMRNFKSDELAVINVQGKILPFKGSGKITTVNTDKSEDIVKEITRLSRKYKSIVVDDFQYVMANEFMRRSAERGYDKFTEIARHAWDIADAVRSLPNDVIVYVLCHTDTDQDGTERLKTIGKLLDEKICLEGMSTIVLKTNVSDGVYTFVTQNNGRDTVKSPAGMFPSYAIDNDLKYVDEKIRNFYELGEFLSDEDIAEIDKTAQKVDIIKDEKPKRSRRRSAAATDEAPAPAETPAETPTEAPAEEEAPKRRSRRKAQTAEEREAEREEIKEKNTAAVVNAGIDEADGADEVDYDEVEKPEMERVPRRKRRAAAADEAPTPAETPEEPALAAETAEAAPRRRRRRA